MAQVKLRSPIGVSFLSFITAGIYYLYWFYRVNEEAAIISRDEDANPGLSLFAASLGALLIVPVFWTHWTTAKRVGDATGYPVSVAANVAFSIVLLPLAGLLYTFWLQGKLNKFGRRERMTTAQPSA
jgi:hypothetical protein